MSRSKRIWVLLGIFVAACTVTFGVSRYEIYKEEIKNSGETILEVVDDEVTALSWKYGQDTMAFHKEDGWLYDEDEAFPVDEDKIRYLLEPFQDLGASFVIENVEDYGQYGLDTPSCTIHITAGEEHEILLGDYSAMDEERYVTIGDGNVYLVKEDPMPRFDLELKDLLQRDEIPEFGQVDRIQFSGEENYSVDYEEGGGRSCREEDVYFAENDGTGIALDTVRVEDYVQAIRFLDLTDYVTYNVSEEELTGYGLDDPELSVVLNYSSAESGDETADIFTLSISRDPKERVSGDESGEVTEDGDVTAYARIGDSKIIYRLTSDDYRELTDASLDRLRHREVLPADFDDISQIRLSLEGTEYTFTAEKEGNETVWYHEEEELEIMDLQSALEGLKADGFTEEAPSEQEEISLTVTLDQEGDSAIPVELYRYDGSRCLAVVEGETLAFVPRSSVVDLIEAVHAIVLN